MGGPLTNTVSILNTATCLNVCTCIYGRLIQARTHASTRAAFNRNISFYLAPKRRGCGAGGPTGTRNVTSMFRVDFTTTTFLYLCTGGGREGQIRCFLLVPFQLLLACNVYNPGERRNFRAAPPFLSPPPSLSLLLFPTSFLLVLSFPSFNLCSTRARLHELD